MLFFIILPFEPELFLVKTFQTLSFLALRVRIERGPGKRAREGREREGQERGPGEVCFLYVLKTWVNLSLDVLMSKGSSMTQKNKKSNDKINNTDHSQSCQGL